MAIAGIDVRSKCGLSQLTPTRLIDKIYPKWNPYHRKVEGEFEEGAQLKIYVLRPDGKKAEVPPHMLRIVENEEITWGASVEYSMVYIAFY